MRDSYSGPLLARGSHLAGAFANCSFGFAGIGDVGDGGVHGTLPVSCAVHYKGNQVLAPAGYLICQQDIACGLAHGNRVDRSGLELHVQKRRRFAHNLVGDRPALEAYALGNPLEEGLHAALSSDCDLVVANGNARCALGGETRCVREFGVCHIEGDVVRGFQLNPGSFDGS